MKILKISLLFLFASVAVHAQDIRMEEVPANLFSAFEKEFTSAKDVEWQKDKKNYKVEFEKDLVDYEVWYSPSGKEVKREVDLLASQIPSGISKTLKKDYAVYEVGDAKMIKRENKKALYKVEVSNTNVEKVVILDENGKVLGVRINR